MKKAKKAIIFLSYIGVGLMSNIIGAERRARKQTNGFYIKFTLQTMGWLLLLLCIPGWLFWGVVHPSFRDGGIFKRIVEIFFACYVYISGVFICWWQIHLSEKGM